MCPHSVTVEPFSSVDDYGAYSYGAAVTYQARVQGRNRMVRSVTGEEVLSTVQVYLPHATITPKDRITLPATFQPTQPKVLDVQKVSDESGQHHIVVYA
jgi:hypothetical protein